MSSEFDFADTPEGPVLVGASDLRLRELLDEMESEMSSAGATLTADPGLTEEQLRSRLSSVKLEPSSELIVWFGWHHGATEAPTEVSTPHLPNLALASIDDAIARYRSTVLEFEIPVDLDPSFFDWGAGEGWLHLAPSNIGLAVECGAKVPARIHFATEDFNDEPGYYRAVSLCTFVAWRIFGLRNGGYRWNRQTFNWDTDVARLHPIQVRAAFW